MKTPWGPLSGIDFEDHELVSRILAADKHQLIEGLVAESLFDQIIDKMPGIKSGSILPLDVETFMVDTGRREDRWLAFVWARSMTKGLGRYLLALEKVAIPWLVEWTGSAFVASRTAQGVRMGDAVPLSDVVTQARSRKPVPFEVDHSVRDRLRQQQAFWGYLSSYYGKTLGERIALGRILVNICIQPWFRSVWNLDRAFVVDDGIRILETKHKFPMDRQGLSFGLNVGELSVFSRLADSDITCLHTVLIKPRWNRNEGSMYLLNEIHLRENAALISLHIDKEKIAELTGLHTGRSPAHTSITGRNTLSFKSIPASSFTRLGVLSDPDSRIAAKLEGVFSGKPGESVEDRWLRDLRVRPK